MTIAAEIGRHAIALDRTDRLDQFFQAVKFLMLGQREFDAVQKARAAGAAERVLDYMKAATSPITTADGLTVHSLVSAFVGSLVGQSIFDSVRGSSLQVPPRSTVLSVSSAIAGGAIPEASAKLISRLSVGASDVDPVKTLAIVVVSAELLKMGGTLADTLIRRELTGAVIKATDAQFLSLISAGGITSIPASGSTPTAVRNDLKSLLASVGTGQGSKLFLLVNQTIGETWAVLGDAGGVAIFPAMTPTGGQVAGMPVIVSTEIPSGEIWLVDASAVATSTDGNVRIDASDAAGIQMDSQPDSPTNASTPLVSLFQLNHTGVRAERWLAAKLMRSDGAAKITGASYSGFSPS